MQAIVKIPEELAVELDRIAGPRKRTALAVEILWREVQRHRQREALLSSAGAWKVEDHPELTEGGEAHVERMRSEQDDRFEEAIQGKEKK